MNAERTALNDRFRQVFELLVERGEIVRNSQGDKGMSMKALASELLGKPTGHIINDYLKSKRLIKYEEAKRFCALFHLNEKYLLDGVGDMFASTMPTATSQPLAVSAAHSSILFAPVEAFASSAEDVQAQGECEYFQIPGLQGDFIAFSVRGNSMQPTIAEGDIVICRGLYANESIKDNEIYAVSVNNAVMVKRVQRIWDKNRRQVLKLKLISDNYLEFDPMFEPSANVNQIWKVEKKITAI